MVLLREQVARRGNRANCTLLSLLCRKRPEEDRTFTGALGKPDIKRLIFISARPSPDRKLARIEKVERVENALERAALEPSWRHAEMLSPVRRRHVGRFPSKTDAGLPQRCAANETHPGPLSGVRRQSPNAGAAPMSRIFRRLYFCPRQDRANWTAASRPASGRLSQM